ncbi:secreted protein C-like [Hetaerina americana]|uniref:secreted protein C-like n=1 Tax=Hetaerina americana TaxID=62018 RepID=UPI003A7F2A0B
MGQAFGLSASNSHHWGTYGTSPYSSYLSGGLGSCAAPSGGFNAPTLGFPAADLNGQGTAAASAAGTSTQDAFNSGSTISSLIPDNGVSSGTPADFAASSTGDSRLKGSGGAAVESLAGPHQDRSPTPPPAARYSNSANDFALSRSLSDSVGSPMSGGSGGGGGGGGGGSAAAGGAAVGQQGASTLLANSSTPSASGHLPPNGNFSLVGQGTYGASSAPNAGLYLSTPVLPASLLYSQLYTSVSQNQLHLHGGELQSAMEQINGGTGAAQRGDILGAVGQGVGRSLPPMGQNEADPTQHSAVQGGGVAAAQRLGAMGQQSRTHTDAGVWRPY